MATRRLARYLVADDAPLAAGLVTVGMVVTGTGLGPWLVKKSASGTTTMPMMTVNTKVTAPHSRRRKVQFTSGEF